MTNAKVTPCRDSTAAQLAIHSTEHTVCAAQLNKLPLSSDNVLA